MAILTFVRNELITYFCYFCCFIFFLNFYFLPLKRGEAKAPLAPPPARPLIIEVLHGGHVACQEQYNIIPMGQNVHSNAKHFYCSWHATWPPCKTSIQEGNSLGLDSAALNDGKDLSSVVSGTTRV